MPAARPEEFRRRAVELARLREKPIAQIAKDLGVAESGLRRWMAQADIDEGKRDGLISTNAKSWSSCAAPPGCRRWRSRSSSARAPILCGRTSSQNDLPGGR
jgi:transposase-like protein